MTVMTNDGAFATGWRLVCHGCRKKYPMDTAISIDNADCCEKPDIHVHGVKDPCEFCDDGEGDPVVNMEAARAVVAALREVVTGWLDALPTLLEGFASATFEELAAAHGATTMRPRKPDGTCDDCGVVGREKRLRAELDAALAKVKKSAAMVDEVRGVAFERQEEIERRGVELVEARDTIGKRGVLLKRVREAVRASGSHREVVDATEVMAKEFWETRSIVMNPSEDLADQNRSVMLETNAVVRKLLENVDHGRPGWPRTMTAGEACVVKGWPATLTRLLDDADTLYTQLDRWRASVQDHEALTRELRRELAETQQLLKDYRNNEAVVWIPQVEELRDILKAGVREGAHVAEKRVMAERNSAQMAHGKTLEALSDIEHIDACACLDGDCEHDLANECLERVSEDLRAVGNLVRGVLKARGEN